MPGGPDEFAISPIRTLARVGDPTPARDHSAFWAEWFRRVGASRPHLRARARGADASDPTPTHEFASFDGVVIGCHLTVPEGPVLAGMVSCHGREVHESLEQAARRWRHLAERGVAVLCVRLRGFPGSQGAGVPAARAGEAGWFAAGLDAVGDGPEHAMAWVVPQCVGDLANACRALRNALYGRTEGVRLGGVQLGEGERAGGARPPVFLHGESLGAGLAVIVAAQLVGRLRHEPMIDRLAIDTPSLGDWPWRLGHSACGVGEEAAGVLGAHPERRDAVCQRLRLLDAVVHASRVRRPTLAKLALRDPVVPAATAAAVFNALGTDPGEKWRFIVPAGHSPAGVASARRHALFDRCVQDFFDPGRTAEDAMAAWEPVLTSGDRGPEEEAERAEPEGDGGGSLFAGQPLPRQRDAAIIRAYERAGRTLDALPYTPEFDALLGEAGEADAREVFHRLHTLRKAGRLPRLGRAPERAGTLEPGQEAVLSGLVVGAAGSMGARDRLPYTPAFDELVERFNREAGLALSHHDVWRAVARLAK